MYDAIVIGAGAVGTLVARELSLYELKVLLLDKEPDVGDLTTSANSAIAHSGYDPVPGTLKAFHNVRGNRMMKGLCEKLDVPFMETGTLTVAFDGKGDGELVKLKARAKENGVEARIVDRAWLNENEPNLTKEATSALLCPSGGIVNPFLLAAHAAENALDNGVELHLEEAVLALEKDDDAVKVITSNGEYLTKCVINCAGVHADDVARMMDRDIDWSITPRKGEYFLLDHFKDGFVKHVLFPLPSEKGKGILVAPTTSGNYLAGPSSEFVESKEDYSTDTETLAMVRENALRLVPTLPMNESIRVYAGLRATPSTHDFIIEPSKVEARLINVAGIESPGLVSSPSIAKTVVEELVSKLLPLKRKEDAKETVKPYAKPMKMRLKERNRLIKENPDYGEIVCSCEKVSLGEIKEVLSRSVPVMTIKGMKKRTRAGFGKCQGGFCQPRILKLIAERYSLDPLDVLLSEEGTNILVEKASKGGEGK